jgi:hypothetical protein
VKKQYQDNDAVKSKISEQFSSEKIKGKFHDVICCMNSLLDLSRYSGINSHFQVQTFPNFPTHPQIYFHATLLFK